ncbi:MAG: hypothetical protein IKE73_05150 [Bacilli bacterium]|nr:hypothetical protein [Bacilli bacterium]
MNEKIELYKQIYQDANMAKTSIKDMKNGLKDKDNKIKDVLDDLIKEYTKYEKESKSILKSLNSEPEKEGLIAKFMANMGIKKEIGNDNSDSHMAEVLIQGISMGSINMDKKISDYEKKVNQEDIDYARSFLKYQEASIEKLKKYL